MWSTRESTVLTVASDLKIAVDDNDQLLNAGPLFNEDPVSRHGDVGRDVDDRIELFFIKSREQRNVLHVLAISILGHSGELVSRRVGIIVGALVAPFRYRSSATWCLALRLVP